jgi:Flp pilus assembly protein TadG
MGWRNWLRSVGHETGFLSRLAHDRAGNTLAIMAAAIIPLAGMVGGGIDMSRMYITKTRLQHACDAGALAGRKQMGGGAWGSDDNAVALQFFTANFNPGSYGSTDLAYSFSELNGKVSGTASAVLPMTLMRVLGRTTETLSVECDAEMRLPNTDVMFVLDTTGSMGDTPAGDTQTKLQSLKNSVKCFYEIVGRLPTNGSCTLTKPSGGTGSQVRVRFGFMPYATNVNVGKLLPTGYFADTRNFQTRKANYTTTTTTTDNWNQTGQTSDAQNKSQSGVAQGDCSDANAQAMYGKAPQQTVNGNTKTVTQTTAKVTGWSKNVCYGTVTTTTTTYTNTPTSTTTTTFQNWTYDKLPVNVGLLKNGTSWNNSFQWPIGPGGANKTITWDGCIEERDTVSQASYTPIPSGAKDLDIDAVPTSADGWGMVLNDLIYTRAGAGQSQWTLAAQTTATDYPNGDYYACPTEAKLLQAWTDPTSFDGYVDSLTSQGNTYHDIGLLWGWRFLSPKGMFASDNALTSTGGKVARHLIFMTDGDPCTGVNNYTAYGVGWFDRRTTGAGSVPTEGCTTTGTLTQQVNARVDALCTAIKNDDPDMTLWVITFGAVAAATDTRMRNCASPGRYYSASNGPALQATFNTIANSISQLRLTQ